MKLIPLWQPSAWPFAKRCLARARLFSSHSTLGRPSPSPWTPGARKPCQPRRPTKASPSTLRRNAKRREEFLKRKHQPAQQQEKCETVKEKPRQRAAFQCDQCDNHFKSESGLKIHIGKSHKAQQAAEILRGDLEEKALNISQQSEVTREEVGEEKGEPVREEEPMYSCDECEDLFFTGEDMDTHTKEIHKHSCIINGIYYSSIPCPGCLVP